jgi:hypothetical protein
MRMSFRCLKALFIPGDLACAPTLGFVSVKGFAAALREVGPTQVLVIVPHVPIAPMAWRVAHDQNLSGVVSIVRDGPSLLFLLAVVIFRPKKASQGLLAGLPLSIADLIAPETCRSHRRPLRAGLDRPLQIVA